MLNDRWPHHGPHFFWISSGHALSVWLLKSPLGGGERSPLYLEILARSSACLAHEPWVAVLILTMPWRSVFHPLQASPSLLSLSLSFSLHPSFPHFLSIFSSLSLCFTVSLSLSLPFSLNLSLPLPGFISLSLSLSVSLLCCYPCLAHSNECVVTVLACSNKAK